MNQDATNDELRSLCLNHRTGKRIPEILDKAIPLAKQRSIILHESEYTDFRVVKAALRLAIAVWGAEDAWERH